MKKSPKQNSSEIFIVGRDFDNGDVTRSLSSNMRDVLKLGKISAESFKDSLTSIASGIAASISDINSTLSEYKLAEINIKLEVSAEGQVAILGNGVSANGTGGIELKFTAKY